MQCCFCGMLEDAGRRSERVEIASGWHMRADLIEELSGQLDVACAWEVRARGLGGRHGGGKEWGAY